MDLGAYANIEDLEKIMEENGIEVSRLRGLRLMKNQMRLTKNDIENYAKRLGLSNCRSAVESGFKYNSSTFCLSEAVRRLQRRYFLYKEDDNGYEYEVDVNWHAIHGHKRKLFKYCIKQARKRSFAMWNVFNKYCGRDDVLYIHARIGGGNWPYYRKEVENEPWFIEKVDDAFDDTYCDIYARIRPVEE